MNNCVQVAQVKHDTGVRYPRPFNGYMMHTDNGDEYHSHHSTKCNITLY